MNINECANKIQDFLASESDDCLELTYKNCRIIVYGTKSNSRCAGEVHLANNSRFDRWANSRTIMLDSFNLIIDGNFILVLKTVIGLYA